MAIKSDRYGNLEMRAGDSGFIIIRGIKTDYDYDIFFQILTECGCPVGPQLRINSNYKDRVKLPIEAKFSEKFNKQGDSPKIYYYAVKRCKATGEEQQMKINGQKAAYKHRFVFLPQQVRGYKSTSCDDSSYSCPCDGGSSSSSSCGGVNTNPNASYWADSKIQGAPNE